MASQSTWHYPSGDESHEVAPGANVYVHVHVHVHVWAYACAMRVCVCVCVCVCECQPMQVHVHVHVYAHAHVHAQQVSAYGMMGMRMQSVRSRFDWYCHHGNESEICACLA